MEFFVILAGDRMMKKSPLRLVFECKRVDDGKNVCFEIDLSLVYRWFISSKFIFTIEIRWSQ